MVKTREPEFDETEVQLQKEFSAYDASLSSNFRGIMPNGQERSLDFEIADMETRMSIGGSSLARYIARLREDLRQALGGKDPTESLRMTIGALEAKCELYELQNVMRTAEIKHLKEQAKAINKDLYDRDSCATSALASKNTVLSSDTESGPEAEGGVWKKDIPGGSKNRSEDVPGGSKDILAV